MQSQRVWESAEVVRMRRSRDADRCGDAERGGEAERGREAERVDSTCRFGELAKNVGQREIWPASQQSGGAGSGRWVRKLQPAGKGGLGRGGPKAKAKGVQQRKGSPGTLRGVTAAMRPPAAGGDEQDHRKSSPVLPKLSRWAECYPPAALICVSLVDNNIAHRSPFVLVIRTSSLLKFRL